MSDTPYIAEAQPNDRSLAEQIKAAATIAKKVPHMPFPQYGRNREFIRVYVLLPPTAHGTWAENAAAAAYDKANKSELCRYTIGSDPDEAAMTDGRVYRIVVAINPHEWTGLFERGDLRFFFEAHYGLGSTPDFEYHALTVKNPPQLYLRLYELNLKTKTRSMHVKT